MAKLTLNDLASLTNEASAISTINNNNASIETALDNTLSRDGTTPNSMSADLDMDTNSILNLPTPTLSHEPATKGYVDSISGTSDSAGLAAAVTTAATSATAAATSATAAATSATAAATSATTATTQATAASVSAAAAGTNAVAALSSTSATSFTPSVASQVLTVTAGKAFSVGTNVLIQGVAANNWGHGPVTAYSGTSLTVNITTIGSAPALAGSWTVTVSGVKGAIGPAGAGGGDFSSNTATSVDSELLLFSGAAGKTGKRATMTGMVAASSGVVTAGRTITGTANLVTVTNGDGVAGNPTLTVGSNVVRKDSTGLLAVGYTHTVKDWGTTTAVTPDPSQGYLQKVGIAAGATLTVTATAEEGMCILQVTNNAATTNLLFSGFEKQLAGSGTYAVTSGNVYWIFLYSIGARQAYSIMQIV